MGGETSEAWRAVLDDLVKRGLRKPEFLIVDGGTGLEQALAALWGDVPTQRCTVHKLPGVLGPIWSGREPIPTRVASIRSTRGGRFVVNSALAGDGFEPSVPRWGIGYAARPLRGAGLGRHYARFTEIGGPTAFLGDQSLLGENRRTAGRIGEDGVSSSGTTPSASYARAPVRCGSWPPGTTG